MPISADDEDALLNAGIGAADDAGPADDVDDDNTPEDDDAGDDDTGADTADDEGDDAGSIPDKGASSRKASRIQRLNERLRVEREARIRAEARAEEREQARGGNGTDTASDAARARAERLAVMTPEERERFEDKEELQRLRQGQQAIQFQVQDAMDKANYDAEARVNPIYARYKNDVEQALAMLHKRGTTASREELLAWVIGKKALAKGKQAPSAAPRRAAAERVTAARGKPTSARSDATTQYNGKGRSAAERLEGVSI